MTDVLDGDVAEAPLCGGCALQTIPLDEQLAAKRESVAAALRNAGVEAEVAPCIDAHGTGRRRATFHARRGEDGVLRVGFSEARSHRIVDLAEHECPILLPAVQAAAEPVRLLAKHLLGLKKPIDAVVTSTETGLDIDLRGAGKIPEKLRLGLVEIAGQTGLARLAVHGDTVVEMRPPVVRFGHAEVVPPPGGFLQATQAGEEVLVRLVLEHLEGAKQVGDLFAGSGTFTLRIAVFAEVKAYENNRDALASLDRAWRATAGLKRITIEGRDLFRRPVTTGELNAMDAVVFDPPRAGAEAQAWEIMRSRVNRVVAVSCNPGTFARDLKILTEGGFKPGIVTPVDQFRHSAHVEAVAVLTR
ncbi:putative RNA methyltransferase [Terrihabitans soli]|uniref:Putative RNA methyltransferase n=1 Tax=Terrihabitans soli TaxID=708113 RepID=A0A6S6QTH8_9HYPH|nr:RNA methyltransferase [Terrihabitans soli]BCJ90230.1 putative RNA methyltransferase [Terrihabitans soli]